MPPSAEQVANYLRDNPTFFEEYAPLLADISLPHPHGGRAISISERQILTLREKNKLLEAKLSELIQFGEENDKLGEKIHHLAVALLGEHNLESVIDMICNSLEEQFNVPHVTLRIWCAEKSIEGRAEFAPVSSEVKEFTTAMTAPYCGQHAVYEVDHWFGEAAPRLKSFALIPLKRNQVFGLLGLASEDATRFYPEMGTLYLQRLSELASVALLAAM
ncbi:MAG: DUF484 family protein [Burkholderiales bacterium]